MIVCKGDEGIEANVCTADDSFCSLIIAGLNVQASIVSNILRFFIDDPDNMAAAPSLLP